MEDNAKGGFTSRQLKRMRKRDAKRACANPLQEASRLNLSNNPVDNHHQPCLFPQQHCTFLFDIPASPPNCIESTQSLFPLRITATLKVMASVSVPLHTTSIGLLE
jgi:hypothetical protein